MEKLNIYNYLMIIKTVNNKDEIKKEIWLHNLRYLHDNRYIMYQTTNAWELIQWIWLIDNWTIFLENYDNSLSAKINNYLERYSGLSKMMYFIIWIIIWLIPFILKITL